MPKVKVWVLCHVQQPGSSWDRSLSTVTCEALAYTKGQSWGFVSCSTARVILEQVHSIVTSGNRDGTTLTDLW